MGSIHFVDLVGQIAFWELVRLSGQETQCLLPVLALPWNVQFFASCWRYSPDAHVLPCSSSLL